MSDADPIRVFADAATAALADAAGRSDVTAVRKLVAAGANPNDRGASDVTLLEWALLKQSARGIVALLAVGADAAQPCSGGTTVMHMAAMAGDPIYLKTLLDHGADPDAPHGESGAPPVAAALLNADDTAFRLLLDGGADPNRRDHAGNTPLHVAAKLHDSASVLALLRAGADPRARNAAGATFQRYLDLSSAPARSDAARATLTSIRDWLHALFDPFAARRPATARTRTKRFVTRLAYPR